MSWKKTSGTRVQIIYSGEAGNLLDSGKGGRHHLHSWKMEEIYLCLSLYLLMQNKPPRCALQVVFNWIDSRCVVGGVASAGTSGVDGARLAL